MIYLKLIYKILLWITLLPVHILIIGLSILVAPLVIKYFTTEDKLYVKFPFKWMETIDNDLSGDDGWKQACKEKGLDPLDDKSRIGWLRRNGGNSFNYYVLGVKVEPISNLMATDDDHHGFFMRYDGIWMLFDFYKLPMINKYLNIFIGWSVFGPKFGFCKYTATFRIKSKIE